VQQQVAEIAGVQRLQPVLVGGVELAALAVGEGAGVALGDVGLGSRPRFFQPSIIPANWRAGQRFSSMPFGLDQLLDQPDLVVGVEDGEVRAQPDQLGMAAQQACADRVEGAEPGHALDAAPTRSADALLHLAGGLVGEGHGQDLARARRGRWRGCGRCGW
jgi:hypothetical protein